MGIRRPVVAGSFYAGTQKLLIEQIKESFLHPIGPGRLPKAVWGDERIPVLVCPHAGYMYSGPVAAHSYASLEGRRKPKVVVIVGPNHAGIGSEVSVYPEGEWYTPLGSVPIDSDLAKRISKNSDLISLDEYSHDEEHSLEVQLPFLQYVLGTFKLLPIVMLNQDKDVAEEVGRVLAESVNGQDVLLIASSDFTHYEPDHIAKKKDMMVIERISALDIGGFYDVILKHNVTACGYGPIAAIMMASKILGTKNVRLLKYATSGDVTGDRSAVVGYASILIELEESR
ncbi:MAG: AmmeMemoRadiSam system protein B [Nitrososphaerota archaeon]